VAGVVLKRLPIDHNGQGWHTRREDFQLNGIGRGTN